MKAIVFALLQAMTPVAPVDGQRKRRGNAR